MNRTQMIKKNDVEHEWFSVDAKDKVLGRLATEIATLLSGKYRPDYTPNVDAGAGVIVLNCGKIRVTGNKSSQKVYKFFSGYPSGQRVTGYEKMLETKPDYILRHAVKGMLPKNKLGALMIKRLKLYPGEEHPHVAQNPKTLEIGK